MTRKRRKNLPNRTGARRFPWPRLSRSWIAVGLAAAILGTGLGIALGGHSRAPRVVPELAMSQLTALAPPVPVPPSPPAPPGAAPSLPTYEEAAAPSANEPPADRPEIRNGLSALSLNGQESRTEPSAAPSRDDAPLWQRNASAMPAVGGRPMLALVIDDVGVDRKRSQRAIENLPPRVTMSFLPYAPEVAAQAKEARARGHEIIVHVPMEPDSSSADPGPHALRVSDDPATLMRNFDWDLGQFDGYVGINNHMGSKFTRDADGMRAILGVLKARGLFFLDSRTTGPTVGPRIAREIGLPFVERDVFLDNVAAAPAISAQLDAFERVARRTGYAIAIGHPHEATLDVLEPWTRAVEARGFVLVPLSAIMRAKLAAAEARPRADAN